jgi:hypothetical protein
MNSVLSLAGAAHRYAARIPQLKSGPVSDKTYWANPLAPQPWLGTGGAGRGGTHTTSASVARILGLWVLHVLG